LSNVEAELLRGSLSESVKGPNTCSRFRVSAREVGVNALCFGALIA